MKDAEGIGAGWADVEQAEKKEALQAAVAEAASLDALEDALDDAGRIVNDVGRVYSADEMITRIKTIRNGQEHIRAVTEACGLRDKVRALYGTQLMEQANSVQEVERTLDVLRATNGEPLLASDGSEMNIEETKQLFTMVMQGKCADNLLTRQFGLRAKAQALREAA